MIKQVYIQFKRGKEEKLQHKCKNADGDSERLIIIWIPGKLGSA